MEEITDMMLDGTVCAFDNGYDEPFPEKKMPNFIKLHCVSKTNIIKEIYVNVDKILFISDKTCIKDATESSKSAICVSDDFIAVSETNEEILKLIKGE